jgi:hypothetical protein
LKRITGLTAKNQNKKMKNTSKILATFHGGINPKKTFTQLMGNRQIPNHEPVGVFTGLKVARSLAEPKFLFIPELTDSGGWFPIDFQVGHQGSWVGEDLDEVLAWVNRMIRFDDERKEAQNLHKIWFIREFGFDIARDHGLVPEHNL